MAEIAVVAAALQHGEAESGASSPLFTLLINPSTGVCFGDQRGCQPAAQEWISVRCHEGHHILGLPRPQAQCGRGCSRFCGQADSHDALRRTDWNHPLTGRRAGMIEEGAGASEFERVEPRLVRT